MSSDDDNWKDGFCVACGQCRTQEGHDPCIANLPGVLFACCGHGGNDAYIKFEDGRCLRFDPKEVDLDLPTRRHGDVPVFVMKGSRIFDFTKKRVKLKKYPTNIMKGPK
jgi:hypothetical protein